MAVLVEAISVVIRVTAIHDQFPGGWPAFRDATPNATLCCDNELACVGFMTPDDVATFVRSLEAVGIFHLQNGACADIVVMDQQRGPTGPCDWAEFEKVSLDGDPRKQVAAARLVGSEEKRLARPTGWTWEESLSRSFGFVPTGQEDKSLVFLRHEDGLDVHLNNLTGEEVFIGRAGRPVRARRTTPRGPTMWVKVLGMLQQNWAVVEVDPSGSATVLFVRDHGEVFDELAFADPGTAEAALRRNGFMSLAEDPTLSDLGPPSPPFRRDPNAWDPVYSSGEYWRG